MGNSPTAPSIPPATRARSSRWQRGLQFIAFTVVVVAIIAIFGYVFLTPLLLAPDQYWEGVLQRYPDVLSVYPLIFAAAIALVLVMIILSLFFRQRARTGDRRRQSAVTTGVDPVPSPGSSASGEHTRCEAIDRVLGNGRCACTGGAA